MDRARESSRALVGIGKYLKNGLNYSASFELGHFVPRMDLSAEDLRGVKFHALRIFRVNTLCDFVELVCNEIGLCFEQGDAADGWHYSRAVERAALAIRWT